MKFIFFLFDMNSCTFFDTTEMRPNACSTCMQHMLIYLTNKFLTQIKCERQQTMHLQSQIFPKIPQIFQVSITVYLNNFKVRPNLWPGIYVCVLIKLVF